MVKINIVLGWFNQIVKIKFYQLNGILQRHENTTVHTTHIYLFVDGVRERRKRGKTINQGNKGSIPISHKHYYKWFERLINIIYLLASSNLAFTVMKNPSGLATRVRNLVNS